MEEEWDAPNWQIPCDKTVIVRTATGAMIERIDIPRSGAGTALLPISSAIRWAVWRPRSRGVTVVEIYEPSVRVNGYNLSPGDTLAIDARDDQISRWI